jgi:hypothetical protein
MAFKMTVCAAQIALEADIDLKDSQPAVVHFLLAVILDPQLK